MALGSFFAVFSVRFCRLPSAAGPPSVTLHLVKKSSQSFGKGFSRRASVGFHCQPVDSGAAETGSANKDEAIQPPEGGYTLTHAPQSSSALNHTFSVQTVRIRPLSSFTCFRLASASSNALRACLCVVTSFIMSIRGRHFSWSLAPENKARLLQRTHAPLTWLNLVYWNTYTNVLPHICLPTL